MKWLGYTDEDNTWEPEQHFFDDGHHLIEEYEESLQSKSPISSGAPSTRLDYSLTLDSEDELTLQVPEVMNDEINEFMKSNIIMIFKGTLYF